MSIDYDHSVDVEIMDGACAAMQTLVARESPTSIADFGCGPGRWLKAANDCGITDVVGIDGIEFPSVELLFESTRFEHRDLTRPIRLGRRFDIALCLEVAEHLPASAASVLIDSLVAHADTVVFSAAIPGQPGQHHVNGQWPVYWQRLFNDNGFVCDDSIRWQIWSESQIAVWYRQNIFIARRNPNQAGKEPRLRAVVHPEVMQLVLGHTTVTVRSHTFARIENGTLPFRWYLSTPARAIFRKFARGLFGTKKGTSSNSNATNAI